MTAPLAATPVVPADPADTVALAGLVAEAFRDLAPSRWMVPDAEVRRVLYPGYFRMYVEEAFAHGEVHTTRDLSAVALWLHNTGTPHPPDPDYDRRLRAVTGDHVARFRAFDRALDAHHPTGLLHHHLAVLAVRPDLQRQGLGTALLDHHHRALAAAGLPAYLEAGDAGTRGLYHRYGYRDHGDPIRLPEGPSMYPMLWRPAGG